MRTLSWKGLWQAPSLVFPRKGSRERLVHVLLLGEPRRTALWEGGGPSLTGSSDVHGVPLAPAGTHIHERYFCEIREAGLGETDLSEAMQAWLQEPALHYEALGLVSPAALRTQVHRGSLTQVSAGKSLDGAEGTSGKSQKENSGRRLLCCHSVKGLFFPFCSL